MHEHHRLPQRSPRWTLPADHRALCLASPRLLPFTQTIVPLTFSRWSTSFQFLGPQRSPFLCLEPPFPSAPFGTLPDGLHREPWLPPAVTGPPAVLRAPTTLPYPPSVGMNLLGGYGFNARHPLRSKSTHLLSLPLFPSSRGRRHPCPFSKRINDQIF